MIALILFLVFVLFVLGIGVLAALSDIRSLKIPNIYSFIIVGVFPLCWCILWLMQGTDIFVPLWSHLLAAGIVFVISVILFFMKVMGAADSKLATAFALWMGLGNLPVFLFMMTVFGALLGVFALFVQKKRPFSKPAPGGWIAQLQDGNNKVPYGLPIVLGAVFGFLNAGYLSPQSLALAFGI